MDTITITPYTPADAERWDRFVDDSRNGTFLFRRGYMDYHADRFTDASIMAFRGDRLVGLLPANIAGSTLYSHQGLTYGGWVLPYAGVDATMVLAIFEAMKEYARANGIREIVYKCVPTIYHAVPSQEDRYALFRSGAQIEASLISAAIDLRHPQTFDTQQRRNLHKAERGGFQVEDDTPLEEFYPLLAQCLAERHGATPVHTLEELTRLQSAFPRQIRVHTARRDDKSHAGVLIYDTAGVAHCQYICSDAEGRDNGALALLMQHLVSLYAGRRYFDFGTSNEDGGHVLNVGLVRQKYGLGGTGVIYDTFRIEL